MLPPPPVDAGQSLLPGTLVVLPADIDGHLLFAALSGAGVALRHLGSGESLVGAFDLADDFAEIGFWAEGDAAPRWADGAAVAAEYWVQGVRCRLDTRISGRTSAQRLRLDRPAAVRVHDRRALPRTPVGGAYAISGGGMGPGQTAGLLDLSNGGACARWPGLPPAAGEALAGWLHLPDQDPVPVRFEVRHISPAGLSGVSQVGLRFTELAPADRVRLTRHLLELRGEATPPIVA
jgi:hypothetical protein